MRDIYEHDHYKYQSRVGEELFGEPIDRWKDEQGTLSLEGQL